MKWNTKPKYHVGQKLYWVGSLYNSSEVSEVEIITIPCELGLQDVLIFRGFYNINLVVNFTDLYPETWCQEKYLFADKEIAEKMAVWTSVKLSEEEWSQAV